MYATIYFIGLSIMSVSTGFMGQSIPAAGIMFGLGLICYVMIAGSIHLATKKD